MIKAKVSISFKITAAIIISFFLLLIVISFAVLRSIDIFFIRESEKLLVSTINYLYENPDEMKGNLEENLYELADDRRLDISIFSQDGKKLYNTNKDFSIPYSPLRGIEEIRITTDDKKTIEYHGLVLRKLFVNMSPPVVIELARNLAAEDRFMKVLREFLFLADLFGLAVSFIFGFFFSKRILRPVDKITTAAGEISGHDFSKRIEEPGPGDELTRLARAFNKMLDRLEASFIIQNRFVSNASHELRTPLAIVTGYINMLSRWAKTDPAILEESISAIKSETARMMSLIEKLLFLARSDNNLLKAATEVFQLDILVEEVIKDIKQLAPERTFILKNKSGISILGDPEMLKQMLLIFLDNSIRYSDPETEIRFTLSKDKNSASIHIRDFGAGIDPEKIDFIFDRFYRIDDTKNQYSTGSGLGLSIAKEIIDFHSGTVSVESKPGEGTSFTINLPLT